MQADGRRGALVTGASGGLGLEFAELLARDGFRLVITARGADKLAGIAADLERRYRVPVLAVPLDLSVAGAAQQLFTATRTADIDIDVLINNAGFGTSGEFAEIPLEDESAEIRLNVLALTELTKLYVAPMLAQRRGKIMNVASTASFQPGPYMAVYCATKAYVLSFSDAIAGELAGSGVTVTCFCPGPTRTGFQARAGAAKLPINDRIMAGAREATQRGYAAMNAGTIVHVDGLVNRALVAAPRFVPRSAVRRIGAKMLKKPG